MRYKHRRLPRRQHLGHLPSHDSLEERQPQHQEHRYEQCDDRKYGPLTQPVDEELVYKGLQRHGRQQGGHSDCQSRNDEICQTLAATGEAPPQT